jgi:hypothetical protein
MKKTLLSIFISVFFYGTSNIKAQSYSFAFSQFQAAYTPITGTDVYGVTPWGMSTPIAYLPMGFNFNFQGTVVSIADMIPGIVAFPNGIDNMGLYTFFAQLTDTGTLVSKSPVTYTTIGSPGTRIFKVQCADAGFANEFFSYGNFSSVVNFQTWFYEADNSIEVHVGPSVITHPLNCYLDSLSPGPSIGIIQLDSGQQTLLYSLALSANPAAPTLTVYNPFSGSPVALNSTPVNSTVYRFEQLVTGFNETEQIFGNVGMFPNPSQENATLLYTVKNAGNVTVEIKDMEGRVVSNDNVGSMSVGTYNYNLNTAKLSNGIYFVTLVSGEQRIIQKLSVAH